MVGLHYCTRQTKSQVWHLTLVGCNRCRSHYQPIACFRYDASSVIFRYFSPAFSYIWFLHTHYIDVDNDGDDGEDEDDNDGDDDDDDSPSQTSASVTHVRGCMAQSVNARRAPCKSNCTFAFIHITLHSELSEHSNVCCVVHTCVHIVLFACTHHTIRTTDHTIRTTYTSQTACLLVRHLAAHVCSAKGATDSSASSVHTLPCSRQGLFSLSILGFSTFVILFAWVGWQQYSRS